MADTSPSKLATHVAWHSVPERAESHASGTRRVLAPSASLEPGSGPELVGAQARPLQTPDVGWRLEAALRVWLPRLLVTAATLSGWLGPLLAARWPRSAAAWAA